MGMKNKAYEEFVEAWIHTHAIVLDGKRPAVKLQLE